MTDQRPPNLTLGRWNALRALKEQPVFLRRPFVARELKITVRGGKRRPASGATMDALRMAGWAEKITVGGPGEGMPFRTGGASTAWRITDAGRAAVAACPDEYPGDPTYGGGQ
jgi:hypothetical protein